MAAVAALAGLAGFGYRYLSYQGFSNDHFVHLATAQQITMGEWPVRDYVERGVPLMSVASAAVQAAFGPGLHAEVVLIAAAFGAAALFVFVVAARLSGSIAIGFGAAAATLLVYPVSYSYPKLLVYAFAFAAALFYAQQPSPARLTLLALSVVMAFLFRHDHGVFLGAGSLVLLAARHGLTREAVRTAGLLATAVLLWASPYVIWVQAYEGLDVYVADGVAFSRREAERSSTFERPAFGVDRARPFFRPIEGGPVVHVRWQDDLPESARIERERAHDLVRLDPMGPMTWHYELRRWSRSALERLVRDPAIADTHGIDRGRFRLTDADPGLVRRLLLGMPAPAEGLQLRQNALAALYYASWVIPVVAIAVVALAWTRVTPPVRALVLMVSAVQLAMNMTMLRDPIDARVRDVVAPLAIALAFLAGRAWSAGPGRVLRWTGRPAAAGLVIGMMLVAGAVGRASEQLVETRVGAGVSGLSQRWGELREQFRPPAHRTGAPPGSMPLADYLRACTRPGARLFAMTFVPDLFFYTGRGFAGGQVSLTPGYYVTDRHATLMLERLAREDVPFVILDSEVDHEMRLHYPRVMQYVDERYVPAAELPVGGDKRYLVFAERQRTAVRTFGADGWPCFADA